MRRRLLWLLAVAAALYVITGLVGVPAVVQRLPELESRRLGRTGDPPAQLHIHGAFAVFPFVVLITYDSAPGNRTRRAVLWFGFGACFLGNGGSGLRA